MPVRRSLSTIAALAAGLSVVLVGTADAISVREGKLLDAFVGLENGTLSQPEAKDTCILTLPNVSAGHGLRQIASGFFQISASHALIRLCESWVAAVAAGELSSETLRVVVLEGDDDRTQARALGAMLRAAHFAPAPPESSAASGGN